MRSWADSTECAHSAATIWTPGKSAIAGGKLNRKERNGMEHINIMRDIMQKEKAREQACKDFTGLYSSHITRPGAADRSGDLKK